MCLCQHLAESFEELIAILTAGKNFPAPDSPKNNMVQRTGRINTAFSWYEKNRIKSHPSDMLIFLYTSLYFPSLYFP